MSKRRLSPAELAAPLAQCQADYDAAKARLEAVGFICEGSLAEIYTCCRKPNCRCADPAHRHGPYWQLTWKEAGKTVSRRLSADEARLYREWIANRRDLESILGQLQAVSRRAGQYLLADIGRSFRGPQRPSRGPRSKKSRAS
jgi:hypothetical protein